MQLLPHVAQVQEQLVAAAALGDDRTKEIAAALGTAAGPAVRLALLDAVTAASAEITAALLDYPGSPAVTVHLDGDDIAVNVHVADTGPAEDEPRRDEGEATARISLRLTETLKSEIDAAAERDGVSVNTWLVRAAAAAVRPGPFGPGGSPFGGGPGATFAPGAAGRAGGESRQRITGWING